MKVSENGKRTTGGSKSKKVADSKVKEALRPRDRIDDELNNRLFFRLVRTVNLYEREIQRSLGISGIQGALMGEIARREGRCVPFAELVDYLGVSRQNLDTVLKRLERAGYVERREDESNRRVKIVHMTAAGLRVWNAGYESSFEFYRHCTQGLTRAAREDLVASLGSIHRALRELASQADDEEAEEP